MKKDFLSVIKKINIKKIRWSELAAAAVIMTLAGMIVVPSVTTAFGNSAAEKCNSRMYVLMETLAPHLSAEDISGEWHDMIFRGKSEQALRLLAEEAKAERGWDINPSDYYFEQKDNILTVRCKKHTDNKNRTLVLGNTSHGAGYAQMQGIVLNTQKRFFDITAREPDLEEQERGEDKNSSVFKRK